MPKKSAVDHPERIAVGTPLQLGGQPTHWADYTIQFTRVQEWCVLAHGTCKALLDSGLVGLTS